MPQISINKFHNKIQKGQTTFLIHERHLVNKNATF